MRVAVWSGASSTARRAALTASSTLSARTSTWANCVQSAAEFGSRLMALRMSGTASLKRPAWMCIWATE